MSSVAAVAGALTSLAALGSLYVYWRKRQTIPDLSFDGYFKTEETFLTGNTPSKVTTYCVRIEDVNPKREGEIRSCAGSLTVSNDTFKTIWMFTKKRHHNFVKEAWLKLFDVDSKDETIGFFDTAEESNAKRSPASYGGRIGHCITMQLEAARGHCPEPHNEDIDYIIRNAQYL